MAYTIAILYGSTRPARLGVRVVKWVDQLLKAAGHETVIVDQAEIGLPMLETPFHHYENPADAPDNVRETAQTLTNADGYVVVVGEYNHAIQPGLANLLSHYHRGQFGYKPSLIASYSYGVYAGVRAATLIRPMLAELGTVSIPTTIAVGSIVDSLDEAGTPQNERLVDYGKGAVRELSYYVAALAEARAKGKP